MPTHLTEFLNNHKKPKMKNIISGLRKQLYLLYASLTANFTLGIAPGQPAFPVSNQSYTTAFASTMDIQEPSKRNKLVRQYGDQGLSVIDVLQSLGYYEPVAQTEWSHFLEGWIVDYLIIGSINVVGTTATIVVDATNIDSDGKFYARLGDQLLFPNFSTAVITNIAGTSLTVELSASTGSYAGLVSGQQVSIISNVNLEGTTFPSPRAAKFQEQSFKSQIIKEVVTTTGTELDVQNWFDVMTDGQSIPTLFSKAIFDAEYRMKAEATGAALFSEPITNSTLTTSGYRGMTGVVPWVTAGGNVDFYNPGLWSLDDAYAMSNTLDSQFAPKQHIGLLGNLFYQDVEKVLTDFYTQNPIIFAKSGNTTDQELNIGFKGFHLDERTWLTMKMSIFSHPKIYAIPNYKIQGLGIFFPNKMVRDGASGGNIPYFGMRYLEQNGYSRKLRLFYTGGAGPYANNQAIDTQTLNLLTECGTEPCAANHWFLWKQN